ncbi:MAG: MipA/OmpV family protein [Gammaproteobacteria bacterium]|nr:MipA/OmpV family protein [Gammaproteobacteria bacterium]
MLKYFLVLSTIYSSGLLAEQTLPQWEAGIWLGGISLPDYRGSNERREYALPLPYFIYRSERLQVNRKGVKGLLYQSENIHIDVGGKVNLPVDSDENAARKGMSDLDTALSIGPTIHYIVYKKKRRTLNFQLPLRAVLSTDIKHIAYRGFTFNPAIVLRQQAQWDSAASLAFLFSTRPYNEYYYDVAENNVRPGRARYQADSGYGGIRLTLITRRSFKKYSLGGFARYDNLRGATYEESPLVTKVENVTVGLYITYQFLKSRRLVHFLPDDLEE